jgi:hypothetical protein
VGQQLHLRRMGDVERRIERERAWVEAEYRQVLKSSVPFEKRIVELERSLRERDEL